MAPVKARVWGGTLLLVAACATLSGCYSGLNGAAVAGGAPPVKSSAEITTSTSSSSSAPVNLVPNGSFEGVSVSPWQPMLSSQLSFARKVHADGRQSLLVRPTQGGVPSFGAQVQILTNPAYGASYQAQAWVRAGRHAGSTVHLVLFVVSRRGTGWVVNVIDSRSRPLKGGWQRLSVRGKVKARNGAVLELQVSVRGAVKPWSQLVVDGVEAKSVAAPGAHG
jgi:hypothetical protein